MAQKGHPLDIGGSPRQNGDILILRLLERLKALGGVNHREYAEQRLQGRVSRAAVERWCLPIGHHRRRVPRESELRLIFLESAGEVEPNDFYPLEAWRAELKKKGRAR